MSTQTPTLPPLLQKLFNQIGKKKQGYGTVYFLNDRVKEIHFLNKIITSKVIGSASEPYSVRLDLNYSNPRCICSCPLRIDCKHIAATLLAAIDTLKGNPKTSLSADEKESASEMPKPNETIADSEVNHWIKSLQKDFLKKTLIHTEQATPEKRSLLFILNFHNHFKSTPLIYLSLISVKFKKNNVYSKTNQIKLNLQDFWEVKSLEAREALEESDWELIKILGKKARSFSSSGILLDFPGAGEIIKRIIETEKCFASLMDMKAIKWGTSKQGHFEWDLVIKEDVQQLKLVVDDSKNSLLFTTLDLPSYYDKEANEWGFIEFKEPLNLVHHLLIAPKIKNEDVHTAHKLLSSTLPTISTVTPKKFKQTVIQETPKGHLKLKLENLEFQKNHHWERVEIIPSITADLSFHYGEHQFFYKHADRLRKEKNSWEFFTENDKELIKIERNIVLESRLIDELQTLNFLEIINLRNKKLCHFYVNNTTVVYVAAQLVEKGIPYLKKNGWTIELDPSFPIQKISKPEEWYLESEQSKEGGINDWFDIKLGVMVDGERFNLLPSLIRLTEKLKLENGWEEFESLPGDTPIQIIDSKKLITLPLERLRNFIQLLLLEFSDNHLKREDSVRISKWHTSFLTEVAEAENSIKTRWIGLETLKNFALKIKGDNSFEEVVPPSSLNCELRPYQKQGLNWMQFLRKCGMNGILADDMGLGKTVQTIAHLLIEKESGRMQLPAIVIGPTSLMPNWFNEAKRFSPSLKVLVLHGNERKSHFSKINDYDLILTTYPLLMRDKEFLLAHQFHLMILDEAQNVKNAKTQAYQVVQQIKANHRLCLSGTPMENHLGELWALFHLLLPGFLGDQKTFQEIYRKPIESLGNQARREALAKRIKPFILRRTKQQVALELPEKTEIIQKIEFKQPQRDLYEAIRLRAQQQVMKEIQSKGLGRSHITVLDALLKLRQVCCDPRLVKLEKANQVEESAKLECLFEMILQMIEENRKILIFSQFTSMLALIASELDSKKIAYTMLTGNTKDRETPVRTFQEGHVPLMLISLKAGGVGLNLTAADTVIHYDPWWNPAAENQATDRAHRIGQKKAVFVYKLVISGSVEEKIIALQERKKGLVAALLDTNANIGNQLTMEDLESIFQPLPAPV